MKDLHTRLTCHPIWNAAMYFQLTKYVYTHPGTTPMSGSANERRRCILKVSLIGSAHNQNGPRSRRVDNNLRQHSLWESEHAIIYEGNRVTYVFPLTHSLSTGRLIQLICG